MNLPAALRLLELRARRRFDGFAVGWSLDDATAALVVAYGPEAAANRLLHTRAPRELGEECERCGRRYCLIWMAPDDLWREITGHENGEGLWCPDCFFAEAARRDLILRFDAVDAVRIRAAGLADGQSVDTAARA